MPRGFFAIGIYHGKSPCNLGTLWRHAYLYDASLLFTVGARYKPQASDTQKAHRHIPLIHFSDIQDLREHLPFGCPLVGVELADNAEPLANFAHRPQMAYLLGAEDHGLPPDILRQCHKLVYIPTARPQSMNVAAAGTLIMYDRFMKGNLNES